MLVAPMREQRSIEQGSMLIMILVTALVMGIVVAMAVPLYFRSTVGPEVTSSNPSGTPRPNTTVGTARSAEAKALAGAVWTALQANAMAACGSTIPVSAAYARAGLSSAGAAPPLWRVAGGDATLRSDCGTGALTASSRTLFTIEGTADDVSAVRVQFQYDATRSPRSWLSCSVDAGATFVAC